MGHLVTYERERERERILSVVKLYDCMNIPGAMIKLYMVTKIKHF